MVGFWICLRYFRDTLTEGPSRDIFHGSRRAAVGITSLSPSPPPPFFLASSCWPQCYRPAWSKLLASKRDKTDRLTFKKVIKIEVLSLWGQFLVSLDKILGQILSNDTHTQKKIHKAKSMPKRFPENRISVWHSSTNPEDWQSHKGMERGGLEFRGAYYPFFCSKRIQLTKVKQPNIKRLMWNLLLENDTYAP